MCKQTERIEAYISPDVLFRELMGEAVLLDLRSQRYYGLNTVGTRIWLLLREKRDIDAVVRTMYEEFDIAEARLRCECVSFLGQLEEAGLIDVNRECTKATARGEVEHQETVVS